MIYTGLWFSLYIFYKLQYNIYSTTIKEWSIFSLFAWLSFYLLAKIVPSPKPFELVKKIDTLPETICISSHNHIQIILYISCYTATYIELNYTCLL